MGTKLNEDLATPIFVGDDISVSSALQMWTSVVQTLTNVECSSLDNSNKLAILGALRTIVDSKENVLRSPAQTSMANVTAATVPAPAVTPPALAPVDVNIVNKAQAQAEEEEEEQAEKVTATVDDHMNPSSEVDAPEITFSSEDPDQHANDEADPDKKEVRDLTNESVIMKFADLFTKVFLKKGAMKNAMAATADNIRDNLLKELRYDAPENEKELRKEIDDLHKYLNSCTTWSEFEKECNKFIKTGSIKESMESQPFIKKLTTQRMKELAGLDVRK